MARTREPPNDVSIYRMRDHPYVINVAESRIAGDRLVLDLELYFIESGIARLVTDRATLYHPKISEFALDCISSEHAKHGRQLTEQTKIGGPVVRHEYPEGGNMYTVQYVKTTRGMYYASVTLPDGSAEIHAGPDFNHITGISAVTRNPNDPLNIAIRRWCREARNAFNRMLAEPIPSPDD